jgi:hypothetical protein
LPSWFSASRTLPLDLSKAVPDTVERVDHVEGIVDCFELVAHSLDVAIDCAVGNVNVIVIRSIHQRIATLDRHESAFGERRIIAPKPAP